MSKHAIVKMKEVLQNNNNSIYYYFIIINIIFFIIIITIINLKQIFHTTQIYQL